jgi:heme exporter protein B
VTLSMGLFALATLVLTHYAIAGNGARVPVRVGSGVVWLTILLASLLGLARLFAAERDEGLLDALLLAPTSRTAIWLSKALALAALLVVLEVVLVPLHWLFFYADAREATPALLPYLLALLLADVGLAAVGSLVAALASAARQREVLLPVLFLPVATPLLLLGVDVTIAAAEGSGTLRQLGSICLYDTFLGVLAWGAYEHVITE